MVIPTVLHVNEFSGRTIPMNEKIYEIVELAKKKDKKAQIELFNSIKGKVAGICRRYVNDRDDLEDLVQEVLIKIFEKLNQFDSKKGEFNGWAYRISVNTAINFNKQKKDFKNLIRESELDSIDESKIEYMDRNEIDEKLTTETILKLLDGLPVGRRTIFNLYFIDGYKHEEIATMLGITLGTSKSQLYWAKETLLGLLKKNKIEI